VIKSTAKTADAAAELYKYFDPSRVSTRKVPVIPIIRKRVPALLKKLTPRMGSEWFMLKIVL
jgi:hypothetical protein